MGGTVVVCGTKTPLSKEGLSLLSTLNDGGMNITVLTSPTLHEQLTGVQIPHFHCMATNDVQTLMSSVIQVVLAVPCDKNEIWEMGIHSFIRAAALKYKEVMVVVQACDWTLLDSSISKTGDMTSSVLQRKTLAEKAFRMLSDMDAKMANAICAQDEMASKNVLLVGGGGREHAIAWKLAQSCQVKHIYVAPGNGGTATGHVKISNVDIDIHAHNDLITFAISNHIDLCVVGPEAPLIDGLADKMVEKGIPTFGPSADAARLEGSKAFSKAFMERHGILTARFKSFTDYELAKVYLKSVDNKVVIKASGIAAGKGVLLPANLEEALSDLKSMMVDKAFGAAGEEVVIEERLEGEEVSVLCFSDGKTIIPMPGAQDHKRIGDRDVGPNTGGMGAYAPAPCLTPVLQKKTTAIVEQVIEAMAAEGCPYVGCLYAGFMLTKDGPSMLEFNCRFGDPETQVVLPLLASDLYVIMQACVSSQLSPSHVAWKSGAAATVVAASGGYPGSYPKGLLITGIETTNAIPQVVAFHAGTTAKGDELFTSGGRVLAVSAWGSDLDMAVSLAYQGIQHIAFDGMQYRKDIALKGLVAKKSPIKIGVLGSTRGSALQPVLDAIADGTLNATVEIVISNKNDAGILERAKTHSVDAVYIASAGISRAFFDAQVTTALKSKGVELVLCVGFMRILSGSFCTTWANKVLNVHPSLLPDFAGGMDLQVHQAVLDAKKTKSGCTVHFVTPDVDAGPIAVQLECGVLSSDNAESLKARVQPMEGPAFIHAIKMVHAQRYASHSHSITYADAGVSIDAGNDLVNLIKPFCKSTRRPGCDSDLGGFGGLFDLSAAGYGEDTMLVACTDGVGTKLKVAQMVGNHKTVGIDLVAMCVNDLIVQGAEPLLFLDYYACGKLDVQAAADVVEGIAAGCRDSHCGLIGGETAEMPSMYTHGDYDLAGFCIGAVKKSNLLPLPIHDDDVLIGLPSSGIHSNGYSLVRKIVSTHGCSYDEPCPYDPSMTLGESLLTPTRIYVKALMPLIEKKIISALAHITGGGLLENIPRVLTKELAVEVNCTSWSLPPVFKWLKTMGNLSDIELSRTFNCGMGMICIVPKVHEKQVMELLMAIGEKPVVIGKVIARETTTSEQVLLQGTLA